MTSPLGGQPAPPFYQGEQRRFFTTPWAGWFSIAHRILFASSQSGPTAQRPGSPSYVGQPYFDTDLDKPIWCKQTTPTVVWVDATGAPA